MQITGITIKNYKSIKELTIPLQCYGESRTTFLIGVNESGKSNILEAIKLLNKSEFSKINFENDFHKGSESDEDKIISVTAEIDVTAIGFWKEAIKKKLIIDQSLLDKVEIIKLEKVVSFSKEAPEPSIKYVVDITDDDSIYQQYENIVLPEEIVDNDGNAIIAMNNQKMLTKDCFKEEIFSALNGVFNEQLPDIQQLSDIQEMKYGSIYDDIQPVELTEIKHDRDSDKVVEIRKILFMSGISDEKEIRNEIDKIISDTSYRETFQQNISQKLTSFLNSVWKQHKIRVCVQFEKSKSEEPILKVQIEDNDKRGLFYATPQRSAGFKHIFSLLLSWAFQNRSGSVKNNIILIDEPEQHLHPSAIRDIRDELLKIGKDNSVIVATHSNYMIDTEHPERHLLVKKEKGETSIKQLDKNSDFYDDEVLYPAFGLNFFKELLPENIIIVEGNNDKIIIGHAFCKLNDNLSFSIKATNGAGSCSKFAKFLSNEKIKPFIIFDEDAKDKKNDILKQQKDFYSDNNVFTLKDLVPELPDNATIEDLLPFEFVQTFFKEKMNITLEKDNQAIMQQLKKLLPTKEGKQKITDLKVPLANRFCDQFKTNEDLEKDAPKLSSLVKCLIRKLKIKAL